MSTNNFQQLQVAIQAAISGTKEFSEAYASLMNLYQAGNIDAGLFLSWLLTQKGEIKDANIRAFELSREIANNTGHPAAIERMADLLLWGVGVEKNKEKSFDLYRQLASKGMLPFTTLAYLYSQGIGTQKDECMASTLILQAAAQGDTLAFMLLSYRYEVGLGVPINGTIAWAFALLAEKRNFPGSTIRVKKLSIRFASITNDEVDLLAEKLIKNIESLFDKVTSLLKKIAQNNPHFVIEYQRLLSENFAQLAIDDLSFDMNKRGVNCDSITPIELAEKVIIRDKPLIMKVVNFASFEECQYLISQALPILKSTATQVKIKTNTEIDAFSGDSTIFSSRQNSPIERMIQKRFAAIQNINVSQFEPVSVLKYSVGHYYSTHTDAFDQEREKTHELKGDFGGQRMFTHLVYLLPPIAGGETHYENIDFKITGETGTAIIHQNATEDFKPDPKSLHTGIEILEGEKWLLRTATRQNPLFGINKTDL